METFFMFTLILLVFFVQKCCLLYLCCIYSNALQTNFIIEANTMNPDQTAPKAK